MQNSSILSVGIDIGTTTVQVAISRFTMANRAGLFAVPDIVITKKELLYKSESAETPVSGNLLDGDELEKMVLGAIARSGFVPADIDTGAVIVTGESMRRANARAVVESLATLAGQFVVASAGPDMEAVIAGQGSGAAEWSGRHDKCVANIDIGGGTMSLACFCGGRLRQCGSFNIGGRAFFEKDKKIVRLSDGAVRLSSELGIDLAIGQPLAAERLNALTDGAVTVLEAALGLSGTPPYYDCLVTEGGSRFSPLKPDALMFSGGVADYVYRHSDDLLRHHDFGVMLGRGIRQSRMLQSLELLQPLETIHATVLGAGSYTMHVSGSTVTYSPGVFPLRNLPVYEFDAEDEALIRNGDSDLLDRRILWFREQVDAAGIAIGLKGISNPPYAVVSQLADVIAASQVGRTGSPLVLLLRHDMAKALGQALQLRLPDIDIICLDGLSVHTNDYVDIGEPIMDGLVVPVVVKSLVFASAVPAEEVRHAVV